MKKLYKKLFWVRIYHYRTSSRPDIKNGERITSISMAYHNSYPAGMQTVYLIESVTYRKPTNENNNVSYC